MGGSLLIGHMVSHDHVIKRLYDLAEGFVHESLYYHI